MYSVSPIVEAWTKKTNKTATTNNAENPPTVNHRHPGRHRSAGGVGSNAVSTSAAGTVNVAVSSMLTLVLVATIAVVSAFDAHVRSGPLPLYSATPTRRFRIVEPVRQPARRLVFEALTTLMARTDPSSRPPSRPFRNPFANTDALAKHRPVTGINARVRWYHRVRSIAGIAVLVAVMGVLVAASVGVAFFAARIVLELLVG